MSNLGISSTLSLVPTSDGIESPRLEKSGAASVSASSSARSKRLGTSFLELEDKRDGFRLLRLKRASADATAGNLRNEDSRASGGARRVEIDRDSNEVLSAHPFGDALRRIVPDVSNSAKGLRKIGRRMLNETGLLRVTNRARPEYGVVAGLAAAHTRGVRSAAFANVAHESVNVTLAAHGVGTAYLKKNRYLEALAKRPDEAELQSIRISPGLTLADIAKSADQRSRYELITAIKECAGDPVLSDKRDKMLDVLISRHVADRHGRSRFRAALYSGAVSVLGIGAYTALAVGSHGVAPAAIAGGVVLSGRDVVNNVSTVSSIRQYYRDKKEDRIVQAVRDELIRRENFSGKLPLGQEEPLGKFVGRLVADVNRTRISRFLPLRYSVINEYESTARRAEERGLVAKRCTQLIRGVINESDAKALGNVYHDYSNAERPVLGRRDFLAFYRAAVRCNPDIKKALQLMRDLGMSKMEAIVKLRAEIGCNRLREPPSLPVLKDPAYDRLVEVAFNSTLKKNLEDAMRRSD